jgi:hypothetical protein
MPRHTLRLVTTARACILRHLRLEEAALRSRDPATGCWAFVADGAAEPALVLGVSGCVRAFFFS